MTAGYGDGSIRLGDGDGGFRSATIFPPIDGPYSDLALGDLNGDGALDLASTGYYPGDVTVRLATTRDGISPIVPFSLATKADSLQAMGMLDRTLGNLAEQRGTIGAFQSRLSSALSNIEASRENFTAAAARIKDADVAQESAALTRVQILQEAASSVLAQANQAPALALTLLSG